MIVLAARAERKTAVKVGRSPVVGGRELAAIDIEYAPSRPIAALAGRQRITSPP